MVAELDFLIGKSITQLEKPRNVFLPNIDTIMAIHVGTSFLSEDNIITNVHDIP